MEIWNRPRQHFALPPELVELIRQKKCVAFLGSGPSIGCYKDWPDLINHLCEQCGSERRVDFDSLADAYLDAAQDARDRDLDRYHKVLGERFGTRQEHINELYNAIVDLPFKSYVTTNLDPKLGRAASRAQLRCRLPVMAYPNLDRAWINDRSVYYIHGFIHEGSVPVLRSIVLAKSEFEEAYDRHSNLVGVSRADA